MNPLTKLKLAFGVIFISLIALAGLSYADTTIYLPIIVKSAYEPEKGVDLSYSFCEDLNTLGAGWYTSFNYQPAGNCPPNDRRFVPVIYGKDQANNNAILTTAINNAKVSGWLIGYGEPNLRGTTPYEGAIAWKKIEDAALPLGIKLVSPFPSPHQPYSSLNGSTDPYGYTWTWKMVEEYQKLYGAKPHFDALGWNYYLINEDPKTGQPMFPPIPQNAIDFLNLRRQEALARGYDIPFWILEYAGACWHGGTPYPTYNTETIQQVTAWFKNTAWVTRYAWFSNRIWGNEPWGQNHQSCTLIDPTTGQPTSLGVMYSSY
jgi:hypothetical protein